MSPSVKRLITNWVVGTVVGTILIAVTSPLFVRSYLPEQFDTARQILIPHPSSQYRWRSEGYATTHIGPHGMPGRSEMPDDSIPRIALWGDSQAEGVCVADDEKLFSQIESPNVAVLPLARSGDDLSNWIKQIPAAEKNLGVDAHVLLIVDLPDLQQWISHENSHDLQDQNTVKFQSSIAKYVPAFVIQSLRNLVTDSAGNPRSLRFSVGPHSSFSSFCAIPPTADAEISNGAIDWEQSLAALREQTQLPILLVYAPQQTKDKSDENLQEKKQVDRLALAASNHQIVFHNANNALVNSTQDGLPPQGFHNGRIGSGHFNAVGYQVIAADIKPIIANMLGPQE